MKRLLLILMLPTMIGLHMNSIADDVRANGAEGADGTESIATPGFSNFSTNAGSYARAERGVKGAENNLERERPHINGEA